MLATPSTTARVTHWTADHREFSYDAGDAPDTVGVRLLKYPAWHVTVDGNAAVSSGADETGQLLVQIPSGLHEVSVEFARTPDRTLGGAISILFVLGIGSWWAAEQRRRRIGGQAL
jgi:hypothetical protein